MTDTTQWDKEIQKAAAKAERDWPGVAEAEEITQEVYIKILESPGTVESLSYMDDDARYRTLHKIAQRIASRERVDLEHFTGNFRYSVNEVKQLLSSGALTEVAGAIGSSWSSEERVSEGDSVADSALATATAVADLEAGLRHLARSNDRYSELIQRRYLGGESISEPSDSRALARALVSLTEKMNHAHKRSHDNSRQMRKVVSNSAARAISSHDYSGDGQSPSSFYFLEGVS